MENGSKHNQPIQRAFPGWSMVAYVVLISIAVDASLLLSAAAHLNLGYSVVVAFAAAVLATGVLFTALAFK
jgi:hypothetical protein